MSINELCDIADRLDQLAFEADGFNKPAGLIIRELRDFADSLREEADAIANAMAAEYEQEYA